MGTEHPLNQEATFRGSLLVLGGGNLLDRSLVVSFFNVNSIIETGLFGLLIDFHRGRKIDDNHHDVREYKGVSRTEHRSSKLFKEKTGMHPMGILGKGNIPWD